MRKWILIALLSCHRLIFAGAADPAATEPAPLLWSFPVGDRLAGPPAAASRWIAVATASGRLFALESDRQLPTWERDLGGPVAAGPLLNGFVLYTATRTGVVRAIDLRSGELMWERQLGEPVPAPPGFAEPGLLWVPTESGRLTALSAAGGEPVETRSFSGRPATAPIRCGNRIVVGSADGRVLGFSDAGEDPAWDRRCGDVPPGNAVCDRDAVLVGCGGYLFRLGLKKGKVLWRYRTGARVTARPVLDERLVYAASYDNQIHVLKRKNGHPVATVTASHRIRLDPLRSGNLMFILPDTADDIGVYRLPGAEPVGRIAVPDGAGNACTRPVLAGRGILAIGCGDPASLYLLRAPASSLEISGPPTPSP